MKPFNTNDGDSVDLVKVRIKSPSAHYSDLLLSCERELSVRGLKGLIETSYPAAPPPADQKLVYAGKLLSDELRLEQFLRFEDDCSVFTIHLVCRIPEQAARKTSDADAAAAIGVDGIRHRVNAASSIPAAAAATEVVDRPAEVTATSEVLSAEARELARIQELLQLAAAPAAAATGEAELRSMEAVYRQYVHLYSQHMLHVQQEAAERQRPHNHQQNDHQLVPHFEGGAAAVAAVEQEGGINNNNNDLLDRVYAITRILLLFSVIYFHSSFFRLLFVAVVAFLAHRFQNNLAPRPQNNNNNNMRAQNNNNNNNEVNLRQGDNRNADNGTVNGAVNVNEEANVGGDLNVSAEGEEGAEEEDKPNVLVVAFTFISSFLSSIIPGYNPPPL
jgi:hypothetical protein